MGPFQSAFKTKDLIEKGVTHILNVSCKEYTKRSKYSVVHFSLYTTSRTFFPERHRDQVARTLAWGALERRLACLQQLRRHLLR